MDSPCALEVKVQSKVLAPELIDERREGFCLGDTEEDVKQARAKAIARCLVDGVV